MPPHYLLQHFDPPPVAAADTPADLVPFATRCAVYRYYNPEHALLYVGISTDVDVRARQHAANGAVWWPMWSRRTIAWYPTTAFARGVEHHAIVAEVPAFNVRDVPEAFPQTTCPYDAAAEVHELFAATSPSRRLLDLAFGVWMRSRSLSDYECRREADPLVAHQRYLALLECTAPWTRYLHGAAVRAWREQHLDGERARQRRLDLEAGAGDVLAARSRVEQEQAESSTAQPTTRRAKRREKTRT